MKKTYKERLYELKYKISKEKEIIKNAWKSVRKTESDMFTFYGHKDVDGRSYVQDREEILEKYEQEYEELKGKIREEKKVKKLNLN